MRPQQHSGVACLEIRLRNEEAINSTRNSIYSRKVFSPYFIAIVTFYLFLNWFSTRVRDDQKHLSRSRLYVCINTWKFKGLDSGEITSLPDLHGTSFQSLPKINRMLITRLIYIQWNFTTPVYEGPFWSKLHD